MNTPAPLSALLRNSIKHVLHILLYGPDAADVLQPPLHLTVTHKLEWERTKVDIDHPDVGQKLLDTVVR